MSIWKIWLYLLLVLCTHNYTGAKTHLHFIWKVCCSEAEDERMKKNISVRDGFKMTFPTYSTWAMWREFVQCFGRFTHDKAALPREMYQRLTGDSSSSANATEAEVDERVSQLLDSEDSGVWMPPHFLHPIPYVAREIGLYIPWHIHFHNCNCTVLKHIAPKHWAFAFCGVTEKTYWNCVHSFSM